MPFSFGEKSSLLLVFFVHALVLAVLLAWHYRQHRQGGSGWLAFFALLGALYVAPFMLGYAGWYSLSGYRQVLFYLPLQQVLLIGPVLFFYVRHLLEPQTRWQRQSGRHFVPALVYLAYTLAAWLADAFWPGNSLGYANGRDKDFDLWYQVLGLISQAFYFGLSLRYYLRYRRLTFQTLSYADAVQYRWLARFLVAFLLMLLLRVLFFILNPEWGEFGAKFWYYLCFSGLLYGVLTMGFAHAWRMSGSIWPASFTPIPALAQEPTESTKPINPEELSEDLERLDGYMLREQAYLNPTLTLTDVAQGLDSTPKQVSALINQGLHMNFNDYVNGLRVAALIIRLENGEHEQLTLLGLALDCGFNSKSTFNRAFKKHQGITPKEYLSQRG